MTTLDSVATVVHVLFGGLWIGSVAFVALAVLPLGRDASIDPEPLSAVVDRLVTLSRLAALVMLATGGHVLYHVTLGGEVTAEPLTSSGRGHLVLTMVVLWVGVIATVEIGNSKLSDGLDAGKLREPTRTALPWFQAAALLGVAVLTIGGMLSAGVGF
ncbi:hypothetical protein L593_00455 [Salinarchaeum sp. Harcht-Bsk1]|uniref:hypothetical protein n=1 Tax=Salinarchaeum sp. Harcht-Bsk1 TaxID=1333523 RepID=UPI0003423F0B|nr:hypothetical protein [Salinarchaeum sp. Harcht-Bsk1]AGN00046.1 hypothetical protein L593_00455 [Salinarchaeum sp. Harcht-Bsk1]